MTQSSVLNPPDGRRSSRPKITAWTEPVECCNTDWEEAYRRFETPEEEIRKFTRRLRGLGQDAWPRDAAIVEIFCGRANGLVALADLGFTNLQGVDLSENLLQQYDGPAELFLGDCRNLGFADASKDIVIVQGGLHHLEILPDDLDKTVREVHRVLRPEGRFVIVEPWMTPFLRFAHFVGRKAIMRRLWRKMDAFARMNEIEAPTYFNWLSRPAEILSLIDRYFAPERRQIGYGKLHYVGRKRIDSAAAED